MLVELRVCDLGVIHDLVLDLGPGLTALTGETGAGKTMIVAAIDLLVGGRADPVMVRPGADEAVVEGRFVDGDTEVVVSRTVVASGRSRAAINGRMATAATLAEVCSPLVDLHGQHAHQSLLRPSAQRQALDLFGKVDLDRWRHARSVRQAIEADRVALGGDSRARAREIDLLRFQIDEIESAALSGSDEDVALEAEEESLADASAHREAGVSAHGALTDDGGVLDAIGAAVAAVTRRTPWAQEEHRLRAAQAELADVAAELRSRAETMEDDPARLAGIRQRRQLLHDLRRKYGETLLEVIAFARESAARLTDLELRETRAGTVDADCQRALEAEAVAAAAVRADRETAAAAMGGAVETRLRTLALPHASFKVHVGGADPGDEVRFELTVNPGSPPLPLAKIASGGELARTMLALRLATSGGGGPATLVFDEVDAGIGGETALAVGRALGDLAGNRQVLVVTHLPQVAAFADCQIGVRKTVGRGTTVAKAAILEDADRVIELSRMLSGQPDSAAARDHAEELLASARSQRPRGSR